MSIVSQPPQCTAGQARAVERAQWQDIKVALPQAMQQPQAKQRLAQRKAIVEPVFSTRGEREGSTECAAAA